MTIIKYMANHFIVHSPTCGEIREILKKGEYDPFGLALAINIKPTQSHYHLTFDETYFVLDGQIDLKLYDPQTQKIMNYCLKANEVCIITKGLHHQITKTTAQNRLCVISAPAFQADDEYPSDKI